MNQKVSIQSSSDYDFGNVKGAIARSIDALNGMSCFVREGERILIKPNILAGKPAEAAVTTHPAVVKAVIELVKEAGATPVVGDSPGLGSAHGAGKKCGILGVCEETGTEFVDLKTLLLVENPEGRTFKRLEIAREALNVDGIINLPKLKTHGQMLLTLSIKNLFGCVPGKRKPQWHLTAGVDTDSFAGMILDLFTFLKPRLNIIDGVVGMEGNGPAGGEPRQIGMILASPDGAALDRVICEIVGADYKDVPILKKAVEEGFAPENVSEIEILGAELKDIRIKNFKLPPLVNVNFAAFLPEFLDKKVRRAMTSRPNIIDKNCTLCNVCVEVCPAEVMTKLEHIDIDYDNCIRCYCCQEMCPDGAIDVKDGWLKKILPGL